MEEFQLCLEIIKREGEKFNVCVDKTAASQITAATAENINYDIAHNRCSYVYRRGAINLSFAKDCFSKFFSDYKSIVFLLSKWIHSPNLTVCSLSKGPALDYIALLLSYQECGMFPSLFKNIKVISKYGAWRNTVNIMHEIVSEGFLKSLPSPVSIGNIEVIQGDIFMDFSQKVQNPIFDSDVVIMMKTLNLQADWRIQEKMMKSLQEFLTALKPGAILFCIDTKPSITLISQEISAFSGSFLFQPTFMNTLLNLEHIDLFKNIFGCSPVMSARGSFFVWQKSSLVSPTSHLGFLMDEVSESVKRLLKIDNDNLGYSDKLLETSDDKKLETYSSYSCLHSTPHFAKEVNEGMINENLILKSENNDLPSSDCIDIGSQNFQSSNLDVKKENSLSNEKICDYVSLNQSAQTEPEIFLKGAKSSKIMALTDRIEKLTNILTELLQTSDVKDVCSNDSCLKRTHKNSFSNDYIPSQCSCMASSMQCKCQYACSELQIHTCKCCHLNASENSSSNMSQQECQLHNQYSSEDSAVSDHEMCKCCTSCCNKLEFSTERKSQTPKLVIPLSNVSGPVIAQIISLLSQSNQEK